MVGSEGTVPKQDWHGTFIDTCTSTRRCDIKDINPLDGRGVICNHNMFHCSMVCVFS